MTIASITTFKRHLVLPDQLKTVCGLVPTGLLFATSPETFSGESPNCRACWNLLKLSQAIRYPLMLDVYHLKVLGDFLLNEAFKSKLPLEQEEAIVVILHKIAEATGTHHVDP